MQIREPAANTLARAYTAQQSKTVKQVWRAFLGPWWKATLAILPLFIFTRIAFLLLTYFGGILFFLPNYSTGTVALRDLLYNWNRWDAVRFATIADQGYIRLDYAAFFPLFPALSHLVSVITHRDALLGGMLVSNVAFLGALIVFYHLVETEFDAATAIRSALYLAAFPTALFFFAGYNESLFLLFMLLCIYAMRRGSWWLAGLFGGLATLTRSTGLLLFVVFFFEYFRQRLPHLRVAWQEKNLFHALRALASIPASLFIPLGLGVFAYGLQLHFGDPLAFSHAQVSWREGLQFPWVAPLQSLKYIVKGPLFGFYAPHNILDLTAFVSFLVLMGLALFGPERFARDKWTFILFGLLLLVYSVLFPGIPGSNPAVPYDPLPSMQRFVLEIFPGFIVLARFGRRQWFHQGYLLLALPMLAFLTLQFLTGHWTI